MGGSRLAKLKTDTISRRVARRSPSLARNYFQRPVGRRRAEQRDRGSCDQHAARDESEDAAGAEALEEERDHKSTEHRGKPAPGIDEADSRRADARRIKLRLIGMIEERHRVVRKSDQHAKE